MSSNVAAACADIAFEKRLAKLAAGKEKERAIRSAQQSIATEKVNHND